MMNFFKKKINVAVKNQIDISIEMQFPDIVEKDFWELYHLCKPYTMTSLERLYSLYKAVNYTIQNNIEGDFVECGVWKGGSALMIGKILALKNIQNRKIFLYDTYEGMSEPSEKDKDFAGKTAVELLEENDIKVQDSVWCYSSFDEVKNTIALSGLSEENIIMIKGKVEDTITSSLPMNKIALLRLDTDWYESTKHELHFLYPILSKNAVLIIDDYGHWQGCRKAVDEYIAEQKLSILLNRIDNTGRLAIKNHE